MRLHEQFTRAKHSADNKHCTDQKRMLTAVLLILLSVAACARTLAQSGAPTASAAHAQGQSQPSPAATTPAEILQYLNDSISWYRQVSAEAALADEPGESLIESSNHQVADEYLRLAFEYARAQAALIAPDNPASDASDAQRAGTRTRLRNSLAQMQQRIADLHDQIAQKTAEADKAHGKDKDALLAQSDVLRSELALASARMETISTFLGYVQALETKSSGSKSLSTQIDELERSVPELHSTSAAANATSAAKANGDNGESSSPEADTGSVTAKSGAGAAAASSASAPPKSNAASGLTGSIGALIDIRQDMSTIDRDLRVTTALAMSHTATASRIAPVMRECVR